MIGFILGMIVSLIAIMSFVSLRYLNSINRWIIITSKFIYYSGHPLLSEDEIFNQITNRFKDVVMSLTMVIFKTIVFLVILVISILISSFLLAKMQGVSIPNFSFSQLSFFLNNINQTPFIIGSIFPVFLTPIFLKRKDRESYTPLDKFLHYVFLGNQNVARFLFRVELRLQKRYLQTINGNHNVYISGMARAGTTVLMQYLGQLSEFKSLSYRNLPFLFLPKTGLKLTNRSKSSEKERFHKDGIKHSIDSYEALEEPFWRNYIGKNYISESKMLKHSINKNDYENYNSLRRLVAGNKIYLAKNNNHLLRAQSLHKWDGINGNNTITFIPFRNPYDQSRSLFNQHALLSKSQNKDEFTLDYMDFLVHHEFGLHFKISTLLDNDSKMKDYDLNNLDSWLEIWYFYYKEVYKQFSNRENFHFFNYNSFVKNPDKSLVRIMQILDIPKSKLDVITIKKFTSKSTKLSDPGHEKYLALYNEMKLLAIN